MRSSARHLLSTFAALAVLAASAAALADVPGRVGRIALMEGDVQAYAESDPQWKVAYVNQPITSRNSVFTGENGRAEITVGSTTLAMDADTQVDIQQLDDNTFNANVVHGRVSMRIRRLDATDTVNVAAPGGDFALIKPGRYRIDALDDSSGVTVFAGQATAAGENGAILVNAGNALRADPEGRTGFQSVASVPVPLDDWVTARESRFREGEAARYVSSNMTGYEELDANGRWARDADYGPVWYPTAHVRDDWVPYRYGRWAYVAPWGYTWIDDAPWGFAPFHYGRWVQVGGRWGWCPGAYVQRPVYAPALVGFYGGSGFSASFSVGSGPAVGWYPLAPWERYSPHYTRNAAYVREVNNITIVAPPSRIAREREGGNWNRFHGGTIAPQQAFASQRSISRVAIAAPREAGGRFGVLDPGSLPRPASIPGAVRNGPRPGEGVARPEFHSPREFASRPFEGRGRPGEASRDPGSGMIPGGRGQEAAVGQPGVAVPAQVQRPARDGGMLPPGYRRLPEGERPGGREGQPFQGPAPGQPDRPAQVQHRPGEAPFNTNARPMQQQPLPSQPSAVGESQQAPQAAPRFQPRVSPEGRPDGQRFEGRPDGQRFEGRPDGQRFERRPQQMPQPAPPVPQAQPQAIAPPPQVQRAAPAPDANQPRFERPHREVRNIQPPPQVQAPQPAPVAPARIAPPQVPQAVNVPPPQPAPQAAPQAPRPEPRERGGREGPGRVNQDR